MTLTRSSVIALFLAGGLAVSLLMAIDAHATRSTQFLSVLVPASVTVAAIGVARRRFRMEPRTVTGRGLVSASVLVGGMIALALGGIVLAAMMSSLSGAAAGLSYWKPPLDS